MAVKEAAAKRAAAKPSGGEKKLAEGSGGISHKDITLFGNIENDKRKNNK